LREIGLFEDVLASVEDQNAVGIFLKSCCISSA